MTLSSFLTWAGGGLAPLFQLELFLRTVLAAGCGAAVGVERSRRFKEAGVRTHMVVACAAAVFMMLSKYAFSDLAVGGTMLYASRGVDASRIAAQVVSGVSFLGIGIIYKNGASVTGLTTAAGIWATAAIGMSIGSGMYTLGLAVTAALLLLQYFLHRFTIGTDSMQMVEIQVAALDAQTIYPLLSNQMKSWGMQVTELKINHTPGQQNALINIQAKLPRTVPFEALTTFLAAQEGITSFDCTPLV